MVMLTVKEQEYLLKKFEESKSEELDILPQDVSMKGLSVDLKWINEKNE